MEADDKDADDDKDAVPMEADDGNGDAADDVSIPDLRAHVLEVDNDDDSEASFPLLELRDMGLHDSDSEDDNSSMGSEDDRAALLNEGKLLHIPDIDAGTFIQAPVVPIANRAEFPMELELDRAPFGLDIAPAQWDNIVDQAVHFQQDIPEDRGADQEDEVFHDPVNAPDSNPDPLTVPKCTPPTFDPRGISRLPITFKAH